MTPPWSCSTDLQSKLSALPQFPAATTTGWNREAMRVATAMGSLKVRTLPGRRARLKLRYPGKPRLHGTENGSRSILNSSSSLDTFG